MNKLNNKLKQHKFEPNTSNWERMSLLLDEEAPTTLSYWDRVKRYLPFLVLLAIPVFGWIVWNLNPEKASQNTDTTHPSAAAKEEIMEKVDQSLVSTDEVASLASSKKIDSAALIQQDQPRSNKAGNRMKGHQRHNDLQDRSNNQTSNAKHQSMHSDGTSIRRTNEEMNHPMIKAGGLSSTQSKSSTSLAIETSSTIENDEFVSLDEQAESLENSTNELLKKNMNSSKSTETSIQTTQDIDAIQLTRNPSNTFEELPSSIDNNEENVVIDIEKLPGLPHILLHDRNPIKIDTSLFVQNGSKHFLKFEPYTQLSVGYGNTNQFVNNNGDRSLGNGKQLNNLVIGAAFGAWLTSHLGLELSYHRKNYRQSVGYDLGDNIRRPFVNEQTFFSHQLGLKTRIQIPIANVIRIEPFIGARYALSDATVITGVDGSVQGGAGSGMLPDYQYMYSYDYIPVLNKFWLLETGVSAFIQVSDNFDIGMTYTYIHGYDTVLRNEIKYSVNNAPQQFADFGTKGGYEGLEGVLRYRF